MNKEEIKATIIKDIQKTKQLIIECKAMSKPIAPDCAIDHSLRMEALVENELTLKTLQKSELKLKNLQRVLHLVDSDKFGICQKCQSKIPIQRILIRPQSLYCINCSE